MAQTSSFEPYALSLLRIVVGFTFSCHGYQKLFGLFGGLGHGATALSDFARARALNPLASVFLS